MIFVIAAAVSLMPPVPAFIKPPPTNHPYHIALTFNSTQNTNCVYWGTNGFFYTNVFVSTNWLTVSNLYRPTIYNFSATGVLSNGVQSDFCPILYFPFPQTNFASVFIGNMTAPVWVETNAIGTKVFRSVNTLSGNSLNVKLQSSTNFQTWVTLPGMIVVTNSAPNGTLRITVTNNLDGLMHPD